MKRVRPVCPQGREGDDKLPSQPLSVNPTKGLHFTHPPGELVSSIQSLQIYSDASSSLE